MIFNYWILHSFTALLAVGIMMALYKVPTTKGHNKFTFSFFSFLFASLFALIFFREHIAFEPRVIFFSFLWGMGFSLVTMFQMELLKKLDTNAVFPITSLLSHVMVLIIGLGFFRDSISLIQLIGIILTFILVGFYNGKFKHITFENGLVPVVISLVLLSVSTKFVQKFASVNVDINNFIFWQLFFAMIGSLVILLIFNKDIFKQTGTITKQFLLWSVALGVCNFVGTVEIVKALYAGPFSLVYTINSLYILITSIIAWKFFGEELSKQKIIFIFASVLAVLLIVLG